MQQRQGAELTRGQAIYTCSVLFLVAIVNYVDRTILSVLQEPIKAELGLSDAQLGLLTGFSFGLVYCFAALPLGWLADRVSRRWLLAPALFIWTCLTGLSGLAASFIVLVILRMGVAVGEAAAVPVTQAMLADIFPLRSRGRAMAIWALTLPLGVLIGFSFGGWLATEVNWRTVLILLGLAGLLLVPLVLTLPSPAQTRPNANRFAPDEPKMPLGHALLSMWRLRAFRYMLLGVASVSFAMFSIQSWIASFYIRVHHLSLDEAGGIVALLMGGGGAIGVLLGGFLVDWLGAKSARWYGLVPAVSVFASAPLIFFQLSASSLLLSAIVGFAAMVLLYIFMSPVPTTLQSVVPPSMRGLTGAVGLFVGNLSGIALGPLVMGFVSDGLTNSGASSADGLRMALFWAIPPLILGSILFTVASRHCEQEIIKI